MHICSLLLLTVSVMGLAVLSFYGLDFSAIMNYNLEL